MKSIFLTLTLLFTLPACVSWASPHRRTPETSGVPPTRNVNTSTPLSGGGSLKSDLTLSCPTCVTTARQVTTTSPLSGGGALSADLTLSCSACVQLSGGAQTGTIHITGAITSGGVVSSGFVQYTGAQSASAAGLASFTFPTLINGFGNRGGGYNVPGYYKDALGFVHLQGTAGAGTAGVMFVLPTGFRPGGTVSFDSGTVTIDASGNVSTSVTPYTSLDGITFLQQL